LLFLQKKKSDIFFCKNTATLKEVFMLYEISPLQKKRQSFKPSLPSILTDLHAISFDKVKTASAEDASVQKKFHHLSNLPQLLAKGAGKRISTPMRIGVVLSGGQASGGHNVIAGIFDALKTLQASSTLYGFLDGPSGIVENKYKELTESLLAPYRNQGGFDLLGSGRTKIETPEQLKASLDNVLKLQLDGLVVIGGDDSNTNAAVLAEYFAEHGCKTRVVGVPKTIDGDLQNDQVAISFGFDSACKVYSEMIGNIARDALSAKKYYHFIKLMGRSASHITLECALATRANFALLGEEVASKKMTLAQVTGDICDMICKRADLGKNYGVVLIPEGLVEFIPEIGVLIAELNSLLANKETMSVDEVMKSLTPHSKECFASFPEMIQKQLLLGRDPHGNVQLSQIETEKLLSETVARELEIRKAKGSYKGKFNPIQHFFGYEGRAGMPSNFDAHYCYALGFVAALLLDEKASGYMCFVSNLTAPVSQWTIGGVPLVSLMNMELRHGKEKPVIKKALLDMQDAPYLFYAKERAKWQTEDFYRFPGPTQYCGDDDVSFSVPLTLQLR
jgi:diphosphate-dependent phosphofructokinase